MALQTSSAISLLDIAIEFGGSPPHSLNEYYGADTGVPASGAISFDDFYGTSDVPDPRWLTTPVTLSVDRWQLPANGKWGCRRTLTWGQPTWEGFNPSAYSSSYLTGLHWGTNPDGAPQGSGQGLPVTITSTGFSATSYVYYLIYDNEADVPAGTYTVRAYIRDINVDSNYVTLSATLT